MELRETKTKLKAFEVVLTTENMYKVQVTAVDEDAANELADAYVFAHYPFNYCEVFSTEELDEQPVGEDEEAGVVSCYDT